MQDLLTPDLRPRGIWWAYKYYADGADSRVQASSNLEYIMPIASHASGRRNYHQLLLASYDADSIIERPETIGIRLTGLSGKGGAKVKLLKIPYDDTEELDAAIVVCERELQPQTGNQMIFSVEIPDSYEVLVLTIEN